ncbi:MAG: hypothetical protein A4E45_00383 [Methanosaeta sp. PtaB.Bin039]|nr:MAG: hypothetical protein A4E45_00383 [Methanosaeta sp. PtaB.Bin039]HOT06280.1 hypothetical protein [Methanotrichaceae archaeon]HQF15721.1 hypothetical protein [Methanotrichaceae archaeon]HQI90606.1 hypothetical protein [Methanotrichaceae archaeon]
MMIYLGKRVGNGGETIASAATSLPFVPFVLGLGVIFASGGNMMYMVVGDALIFLAGVAFMKILK